jgi:uncharacterized protein involved in response to NO
MTYECLSPSSGRAVLRSAPARFGPARDEHHPSRIELVVGGAVGWLTDWAPEVTGAAAALFFVAGVVCCVRVWRRKHKKNERESYLVSQWASPCYLVGSSRLLCCFSKGW